jgi:hypothetical protein
MNQGVKLIGYILSLLLLTLTVRSAEPRTVSLTTESGEILSGTVQSSNDERIVLRFEKFGIITIPANAVTNLGKQKVGATPLPDSKAKSNESSISPSTEKEPQKGILRTFLHVPDEVSVTTTMGASFLSGQTSGDTVEGKLTIGYDKGRYLGTLSSQYRYGKFGGRRVTDEYQLLAQAFRYFGENGTDKEQRKYFAILQNIYEVNTIRSIRFDYDFLLGLGLDIHKNKKSSSLIAAGFNGELESLNGIGTPDPVRTEVARAYIYSQFNWQVTQRLSLQSSIGYQVKPSHSSDYELQSYSVARYALAPRLSLDLNYSYLFDDIPLASISPDTSRVSLALSYEL